jgi:hypothetical protein
MRPSSGFDVHDLRVVVADLVGELGVDVHYLIGERADALRDQDVVQDRRIRLDPGTWTGRAVPSKLTGIDSVSTSPAGPGWRA